MLHQHDRLLLVVVIVCTLAIIGGYRVIISPLGFQFEPASRIEEPIDTCRRRGGTSDQTLFLGGTTQAARCIVN
jgi:hypothetical protein